MTLGRILAILLVVVAVERSSAQTPQDAFHRGNELYRAGQFQQASTEYESILHQGFASAEVFFNLGNTYYRQGKVARAILAYERAARLNPNDPDIKHNLRLLSLKTVDRIEPVPELFLLLWMRALGSLIPVDTTAFATAVAWIFLFCSLAAISLIRTRKVIQFARAVVVSSLLLVVLGGVILAIQIPQSIARDQAIITASVVTAKSSPDEQSVDAFVIHEGLKVKMSDSLSDWVKITLADGKVGWIKSLQCERI